MKRLALFSGIAFSATAFALMEPATPESQGVSSEAILKFIDGCEKTFGADEHGAMHGFVIVRHGKVIAEGANHKNEFFRKFYGRLTGKGRAK